MIRKMLGGIVIYSLIMFIIVEFGPNYDFYAISIDPANSLHSTPFFLLIGGIFWFLYDILRRVLKVLTIPFNWITFGLMHVIVNIVVLYGFGFLINSLELGIEVTMGSLVEIFILSLILGVVGFFIKYL